MTLAPGTSQAAHSAVRAGLGGAGLWLVLEFAARYGVLLGGGVLLAAAGKATPETLRGPAGLVLNAAAAGAAMVLLGLVFFRRSGAESATAGGLGYRLGAPHLLAGAACGILLIGLLEITHGIDERIFASLDFLRELLPTEEEELGIAAQAGLALAVVLIPTNGILTPIVEEFAWRGYIQTRLVATWGPLVGVAITAACFAAKHMIVDLSIARTSTLIVGSVVLGLVGHRWGTGASTVTHLLLNLTGGVRYLLAAAAALP